MEILNEDIKRKIQNDITVSTLRREYDLAIVGISSVLDQLYDNIPGSKRISYGRVYTIKVFSEHLYTRLTEMDAPVFQIAVGIFEKSGDSKATGVSLGI